MNRISFALLHLALGGLPAAADLTAAAAGGLTPLSVSSNHRYLQDGHGRPFFLVGDSPQNLPLKLAESEFDGFMAECALRGFNLLWICIDGQTSDRAAPHPPKDRQGRLMMMKGWDIGTLNERYFLTIDAILQTAERQGIYCMLTPLSECQWSQADINRNPPEKWDYEDYRDNGGRIQAKHFKRLFTPREWWTLVPDYGHTFVTAGYGTLSPTTMDYVGAAINPTGTLGLAYCPKAATITVALSRFSAPVVARWFDPTNGRIHSAIEGSPFPNRSSHDFSTPGANIAGGEDWVLVLETRPLGPSTNSVSTP